MRALGRRPAVELWPSVSGSRPSVKHPSTRARADTDSSCDAAPMDAGGNRPAVSAACEGDPEPNPIPDGRPGLPDGDHNLVIAAQAGDRTAFDQLAQRHSARLRRVLVRITGNPELAENALQDALLRAWQNLSRFQRRSSFLTWLTRIAINEAYRTHQRSESQATLPFDDAVGERIPAWGANPEAIFTSRVVPGRGRVGAGQASARVSPGGGAARRGRIQHP